MDFPTDIILAAATLATLLSPSVRALWRAILKKPSQSTLMVRQGDEVVTLEYDAADGLSEIDRERLFDEAVHQMQRPESEKKAPEEGSARG